jgi:hypothetical protein
MPCSAPNFAIRRLHDGSTITSKLNKTMSKVLHSPNFVKYMQKKHGWTHTVFDQIHWDAHELAFKWHTKNSQVMITKIIHNLVNTNQQNHKYYGKSPLCPSCNLEVETLPHVLSCQSPGASKSRAQALSVLQADLTMIGTPPSVIAVITHGILE